MQSGDTIGAWLALRYGSRSAGSDVSLLSNLRAAAVELIEPKRRKAIQTRLAESETLRRRVPMTIGSAERRDFANQYGIREEYVPA
jgi:hypothetical protein